MPAPLPLRTSLALAVLSGLLFVPGFPPLGWWPCTLVAFAPLYLAIEGQTPRRAFQLGWTSLLVSSTIVFSWLVGTVRDFGGLPTPVALGVLLLLSAFHGGRLGLATWLASRAEARGWPAAPAFVLAYLTSELLYPLIFTWYVASAAVHALPLMQPAELGGPLLVDLVLLAPSVALGEAARAWRAGRRPQIGVVAVGLLLPLLAAAWGQVRIGQVRDGWASAETVRIGLVQPNASIGADASVEALRASTQALAAQGAELVIWPETAIHESYNDVTYVTQIPARITHDLGVPTLVGVRLWGEAAVAGNPHTRRNTVLLVNPAGIISGRYDKHELLPFGEYTPFGTQLPWLAKLLSHTGHFSPGEGPQAIDRGAHRIAVLVCYEDILPAYLNTQVRAMDPDLLVNVTNDAWFGDTGEPWIHLGEAQLRAIEHRRFLVRATNSGPSGVVDATGATQELGSLFVAEDRVVSARFLHSHTLYESVGDVPWWIGAVLSIGAAFVRRGRATA